MPIRAVSALSVRIKVVFRLRLKLALVVVQVVELVAIAQLVSAKRRISLTFIAGERAAFIVKRAVPRRRRAAPRGLIAPVSHEPARKLVLVAGVRGKIVRSFS